MERAIIKHQQRMEVSTMYTDLNGETYTYDPRDENFWADRAAEEGEEKYEAIQTEV